MQAKKQIYPQIPTYVRQSQLTNLQTTMIQSRP